MRETYTNQSVLISVAPPERLRGAPGLHKTHFKYSCAKVFS